MTAVIFLCVLVALVTAAYGGYRAAIWVPMARGDAERVATVAEVTQGQIVYDLGCGDGRVLEAAAARGATAIGYEVSLIPYLLAWIRKIRSPYGTLMHVRFGDFWFADISDADVVCVYLMEKVYPKLLTKLQASCRADTTLITYVWPLATLKPTTTHEAPNKPKIWRYSI